MVKPVSKPDSNKILEDGIKPKKVKLEALEIIKWFKDREKQFQPVWSHEGNSKQLPKKYGGISDIFIPCFKEVNSTFESLNM